MEDMNTRGSASGIFEKKVLQPRLIIQALAFTGILYFCVGQAPQDTTRTLLRPVATSTTISPTVGNSVLQHASHQSGLPPSALRIDQVRAQTWADNCLGLNDAGVLCKRTSVAGWQVAVVSGRQRWIYRTDASGSVIKLETRVSLPSS